MNKEQAYCCLNCANLPSCNAAAGDCEPCCSDCGDTSICQTSAYYFKDGKFYTDFSQSVSMSNAQSWDCQGCTPMDYDPKGTANHNLHYVIDTEFGLISCNSFVVENFNVGPGDPWELTETANLTSCSKSFKVEDFARQTASGPCPADSPEGDVSCDCCSGNVVSAVNGCSDPLRPLNSGGQTGIGGCGDDCLSGTGDFSNSISVDISFRNEVKLYNYKGEDVGNIIGATYNPCNATRLWGPPPCHFFAP